MNFRKGNLLNLGKKIKGEGIRIAGVHIERSVLVIRDSKSGKISSFNFETIEELFNSKEIKKCDKIYINAGKNNFIVKTKFFPDKSPCFI